MRNLTFYLLLLSIPPMSSAQGKYDYNWVMGYGPNNAQNHYGGSLLRFQNNNLDTSFFSIEIGFFGAIASISDRWGNLVAYTNGCQVQNPAHGLMENGDSINPGILHNQQCDDYGGYPGDQNVLFLPLPGSDSLYYLFHMRKKSGGAIARELLYTTLDASANEGLGKVLQKNILMEEDTFVPMMTAVRHANGRDWWLMLAEQYNTVPLPSYLPGRYHRYLLSPSGVSAPIVQEVGTMLRFQSYYGQACFSPDGSHYAYASVYNGIHLFDFDRCEGLLSGHTCLDLSQDTVWIVGAAFSPNSRWLYVSTGLHLYQYDVLAADIGASRQTVATYDGYQSPFPTYLSQLMLAPDGKIYGTAPNGVDVLHVVHSPDLPGLACGVEQHGLRLPTYHAFTIPNFAHFRLYDAPGSACDTLGIDGPVSGVSAASVAGAGMAVHPNPAGDYLRISLPAAEAGVVALLDLRGQARVTTAKEAGIEALSLPVGLLPTGTYFVQFRSAATGRAYAQKAVIQH
jgi:hypothetical protein